MDHKMDFGINLAQDTMSNAEKREKKIQPGSNMDMRNATQNFLAAELGGGFIQQQPSSQKLPSTTMHDILTQDSSDLFQSEVNLEQQHNNPFSDQHHQHQNQPRFDDDDEFEHDSLNFSPATISKSNIENENVKFISSKDLIDDFDNNTGKINFIKSGEAEPQTVNQFVNDSDKNELIVNLGQKVDLEFKVNPDNVKLISSDTLLDDFDIKTKSTVVPGNLVDDVKNKFNEFVSTDLGKPIENISNIASVKFDDFHMEPQKQQDNQKINSPIIEDFELIKPISTQHTITPTAPELVEQQRQFSGNYEDEFFGKNSGNISPIKSKITDNFDHDKFISDENFGSNFADFMTSKAEDIKENVTKVTDDMINKISENVNPFTSTLTPTPSTSASTITPSSKVLKTEPKITTNIMQGEVIFHKPTGTGSVSGTGKSNFNLHPVLESLIYWRDIKISGIVFIIGLLILLSLIFFSVISVFAYTSLIALMIIVGYRIYKYVLGMINNDDTQNLRHPYEEYLQRMDIDISQERAKNFSNILVANLNAFSSELKRLFLVDDYVESIKFGIILWILTYIGSWFNGMTLIIIAYILLFTIPIVYEQNKSIIDQNIELVKVKMAEISDKIQVYIPIGKNTTTSAAETDKNK